MYQIKAKMHHRTAVWIADPPDGRSQRFSRLDFGLRCPAHCGQTDVTVFRDESRRGRTRALGPTSGKPATLNLTVFDPGLIMAGC